MRRAYSRRGWGAPVAARRCFGHGRRRGGTGRGKHIYRAIAVVRRMGCRLSIAEGGGAMLPRLHAVPGAEDSGGCSSATTPAWPRIVAHQSGV